MGILAGVAKDWRMNSRENNGYLSCDVLDLTCSDLSIVQNRQKTSEKNLASLIMVCLHFMGDMAIWKKDGKIYRVSGFRPVYPVSSTKAVVPGILRNVV